jgi:SAM-dependent methyltransferase
MRSAKPGEALDLACGAGREAIALAAGGWRVTGVDHLPEIATRGPEFAVRYLPDRAPSINWVVRDLEKESIPSGSWDLVTMFFYLDRPILQAAAAALRPGGSLLVETFMPAHRRLFGKPRNESLTLQPGELLELLPSLEVLRYDEGWSRDRITARYWGRKTEAQL